MFRATLTTLLLSLTTPVFAFEIEAMSQEERDIFRAEIRAYLLENPEVLMEAIAVLEERRASQAALAEVQMLKDNHDAIYNDGFSYVGGNLDGDVTVVEFLDYRCGFCKRAHPEVMELIASDGGIRYIVKEFPILGPESELASRYAIATKMIAGDESYAIINDKLMTWNGPVNEGALGRLSGGTGVDHEAIMAHMQSDEVTAVIDANRSLAQLLQIQGTPSFIMGDAFVRGYAELPQMRAMVEAVRADNG